MSFLLKFKYTVIFLLLVGGIATYYYSNKQTPVQHALAHMPPKDKQHLTDFFEELVYHHCFGYTLFGDKPIVFTSYFVRPLLRDILFEDKSGVILRNGEKTWKLYEKDFKINNFILKFHSHDNISYIFLINKNLFLKKIEEHNEYISQVFKCPVDAQALLNRLENEPISLFDLFQHHDDVLGIMLGYGKQNSMNFQRYTEIDSALYEYPNFPYKISYDEELLSQTIEQKISFLINKKFKQAKQKRIVPNTGFANLLEEYNYLQSKLQGIHKTFTLQRISFPGFRADLDSDETRELLDSFSRTRTNTGKIYEKGDFLEITLNRLHGTVR